jgi:hypothetical protein
MFEAWGIRILPVLNGQAIRQPNVAFVAAHRHGGRKDTPTFAKQCLHHCPEYAFCQQKVGHSGRCRRALLLTFVQTRICISRSCEAAMTDEEFYDTEVAPALADLTRRCEARGMGLVALVGYDADGSVASTVTLPKGAAAVLRWAGALAKCWCRGGAVNLDQFILGVMDEAGRTGHSSLMLARLGVPATPDAGNRTEARHRAEDNAERGTRRRTAGAAAREIELMAAGCPDHAEILAVAARRVRGLADG